MFNFPNMLRTVVLAVAGAGGGGIWGRIGGALLEGGLSGLSKRAEAQIGGKKAAMYGATGMGYSIP